MTSTALDVHVDASDLLLLVFIVLLVTSEICCCSVWRNGRGEGRLDQRIGSLDPRSESASIFRVQGFGVRA